MLEISEDYRSKAKKGGWRRWDYEVESEDLKNLVLLSTSQTEAKPIDLDLQVGPMKSLESVPSTSIGFIDLAYQPINPICLVPST